ncbi:BLUF domain-containing protein [Limnobacter alexandrii]|jgi:hypothetical protein|uniref:BLUF domain-containing protein n=1 Tax=Limnobacter alexandrii TaxID=2570352 RepID=UPI0011095F29|nr:BLUF domain-containing protein [Limnobacter alexandrii]
MLRLIYTSVQVPGFDRPAFEHLCEQAATINSKLGIEGLLLCNGVEFMQCLEGPKEAVVQVYRKIVQDRRHSDIRLLVSEPTNDLMFKKWSMMGLVTRPQDSLSAESIAYTLLDHRLYRPWRSLGLGAADLIYEYAKVKAELEKAGEVGLLSKVFEVYEP